MYIINNSVDNRCEVRVKKKFRIGRNVTKKRKERKKDEVYLKEEEEN